MKKQLILALAAIAAVGSAYPAVISPEEALGRLESSSAGMARKIKATDLKLAYSARSEAGKPVAYVFSNSSNKGFTILSANDVAIPVLGYSDVESFDAGKIPTQLQWWLSEMGRRMEFLESKGFKADEGALYAPAEWTAIEPLCKTRWDQTTPYNDLTPTVNGKQAPTGCVATSFAQAMKYFNYPERGNGIITYRWGTKNLRMNLETTAFQWDKMLDSYTSGNYNEEQAKAVATLMKACGYGVEMGYGEYSSGAQSYKLVNALINYFSYDPAITYEDRNLMSYVDWSAKIYDNIKNIGPVIYDGTSIDGGHSFICDGYDGNGYFHFNWGWGGISDGYYSLDVLNPDAQGTGGSLGGFNFGQNAVLGIQKPTGKPAPIVYANLTQLGTADVTLDGKTIVWGLRGYEPMGWTNQTGKNISVGAFACFESTANGAEKIYVPYTFKRESGGDWPNNQFDLGPNYYVKYPEIGAFVDVPESLKDGEYLVTFVVKDLEMEDAPYQPVEVHYGYSNSCVLTIAGGKPEVQNVLPKMLSFEDVAIFGKLYNGKNCMISATVKNTTDFDLSDCVQPVLTRGGKIQYVADNFIVSVPADSETENRWIVQFYTAGGADDTGIGKEFTLQMQNRTTGELIGSYGEVTMDPSPGNLKLEVNDFYVADYTSTVDFTIGNKNFKNVYVANNAEDVEIVFDYTVVSGFFDSALHLGLQWYDKDLAKYVTVADDIYKDYPFLSAGDEGKVTVKRDLSNYHGDSVYQVRAYYVSNGTNRALATMQFTFASDGIEDITSDADSAVEYFNLQGIKVDSPVKGQTLIRVCAGKSEKIVF